jgi:hypothetical protein
MTIPRMRTINELVREIKEQDPTTAISYNYVRTLCKTDKIRCILVNSKYLIDFDAFIKYLYDLCEVSG